METQLRMASSAIALAAMVLIWNEAPIAESPSDHEVDHRMAYSDRSARPRVEGERGAGGDRGPERVVRGDRTGAGPAARPEPGRENGSTADVDRTGAGSKAEPPVPHGGAPNVAH